VYTHAIPHIDGPVEEAIGHLPDVLPLDIIWIVEMYATGLVPSVDRSVAYQRRAGDKVHESEFTDTDTESSYDSNSTTSS
jgi:hypothetical protein